MKVLKEEGYEVCMIDRNSLSHIFNCVSFNIFMTKTISLSIMIMNVISHLPSMKRMIPWLYL